MNTGQFVARVLDPGWPSKQAGRPIRVARLWIKPCIPLAIGLDDTVDHPAGQLRILQPIGHNKAARVRRGAGELGLETTEHELGELLAQTGPLPADPRLLKRIATATAPGKLGCQEASQTLCYNPLRGAVVRDGTHVMRVTTGRDKGVTFDRFIAGVVEALLHLDDGILDGVSVHALTDAQDLASFLAGNPLSRPSDENRLSRAASDSDGGWLSRAVSDFDGGWLSRAASEASGSCRSHSAADHDPTQSTPNPICAVGAMLTRLHVAGIPGDLARSLVLRAPDPVAQGLVHAALSDELTPGLAERTCRVVARLPGVASAIPVLPRDDLSPNQVLTARTGDRVWLTDFDRVCLTPRAIDLRSSITVLDDDAFLDGYRDGGDQLPPGDQLRRAVAASLILRVADPLKHAPCAWEQEISVNLDRIVEILK